MNAIFKRLEASSSFATLRAVQNGLMACVESFGKKLLELSVRRPDSYVGAHHPRIRR